MVEFKLPELGENIDKAEVIRVLVGEGDRIKADQTVFEVESEKAAMSLPCPIAGRVAKVHVREGDAVSVGQPLLSIEETKDGEKAKAAAPKEKEPEPKAEAKREPQPQKPAEQEKPARETAGEDRKKQKEPAAADAEPSRHAKEGDDMPATGDSEEEEEPRALVAAGPATRRLARELGVDLHQVPGTGPGGRITQEDVQAAVRSRQEGKRVSSPPLPDFAKWGAVERQPQNPIGRATAQRMHLAWQLVPHVTQHALADITDLEAARRRLVESGSKITMTALAVKAAGVALKAFPHFNSSYDAEKQAVILKRYIHIGVAVDTPHGLLVPVIRDADRKSVRSIAAELTELAENARQRKLHVDDMQGGTFTISNLGGIGGTAFTPIVNYPEVAILGIARAHHQLVQRGEKFENRLMLPLSLSYDHRVVNGADGARFVTRLAELLSDPLLLLIEI